MSPVDLVFWYPGINPYLAERFSALARSNQIGFECWFTRGVDPQRSWHVDTGDLSFPHRFVPNITLGPYRTGLPVAEFAHSRPKILVSFHADPLVAGSVTQHLMPHGKLVYYVEKTFDTWTQRSRLKEAAKHGLFRLADGFLAPGQDADQYLQEYGVPSSKIYRLHHAINVERFSEARALRDTAAHMVWRQDLGLHGFVFLNIGRMWRQKGIATLLTAYQLVKASGLDCSLLLVGDGLDRPEFIERVRQEQIRDVVFIDYVQQERLVQYYALGDGFVFPTRGDPYGLVVDEASASGLPIISSTMAGEIRERVRDGINGYLVNLDSPTELADAMLRLGQDKRAARLMGEASYDLVKNHTTQNWAYQIEQMCFDLLKSDPPST